MASTDALAFPEQAKALRVYGVFTLVTTGEESSGALTALAASVSKDGGAYVSCTNAPVQQGTTGLVYVELTEAETTADFIVVKFTSSLANTVDVVKEMYLLDWASKNGRGDSRFEELLRKAAEVAINRHVNSGSGYQVMCDDDSTVSVEGTITEADTTAARGKLS